MTIRDRKALRQTANRRLQVASYKPNRLVLIHSGIALGASLLVAIVQYILQQQTHRHTGLSGVETRVILETAATALSVIVMVLTPFWNMGRTYAALRIARGKSDYPHTLAEGFRRWGPVLRLNLMLLLIYGILCFVAMYASSILYVFTPAGAELGQQLQELLMSGQFSDYYELAEALSPETIRQIYRVVLPIFGVVAFVLLTPAFYRMRMATYVLMDQHGTGAWKAIRTSGRIMRHKGFQLFQLDLSYWWYYLLSVVVTVPMYADLLLGAMKISVPVADEVLMLAGHAVYAVLMLVLDGVCLPKIMTTYALAYDALLEEAAPAQPAQTPQHGEIYGAEHE